MTARTFDELFDRDPPHLFVTPDLTLNPASPWRWRIEDLRTGQLWCPAPTLDAAERFMRAAEAKGDATVDESSIQICRLLLRGHSVKIPSSGLEPKGAGHVPPVAAVDSSPESAVSPTDPDARVEFASSPDTPSNVIPFRGRMIV